MQGTGTISDLVAGLDWVASNAKQPAVATLSLGVPVGQVSACCPFLATESATSALACLHRCLTVYLGMLSPPGIVMAI